MERHFTDDTRCLKELLSSGGECYFLRLRENEGFLEAFFKENADELGDGIERIKVIGKQDLKKHFNVEVKIIGVTGTDGKTTTAAVIHSLLSDLGYKTALIGTRGVFIGKKQVRRKALTTPPLIELYECIQKSKVSGCQYVVMEVSSHAIAQDRIYGLVFDVKVITNITSDHLDYHGSLQNYTRTKMKFMETGNCAKVINLDDDVLKTISVPNSYGYSTEKTDGASLSCSSYHIHGGIQAKLILRNVHNNKTEGVDIQSSLIGKFNLQNIMAAIMCVNISTRASLHVIAKHLVKFSGVPGRMEVVSKNPMIVIDFAHTSNGMENVFKAFESKNIAVVFGAGGCRDKTKRKHMGRCAEKHASRIYITSDNPRDEDPNDIVNDILEGISSRDNVSTVLDRRRAISLAIEHMLAEDSGKWVLLILGKGDEREQIIKGQVTRFDDKECVMELLDAYVRTS